MKIRDLNISEPKVNMDWNNQFFAQIDNGECISYFDMKFFEIISRTELRKLKQNDTK